MKRYFLSAVSVAALSAASQAWAADLVKPAYKAPAPAAFGWSGFYVGAAAGGALQNTSIDDKTCNLSCSSLNLDGSGFTAGGIVGWNYQFGAGLIGIEGDINWGNFKGEFVDQDWGSNGTIHSATWNWFSTVRGRAGLIVDRALIYVTGGVAFVDVDIFGNSPNGACSSGCFSISGVETGIAAGFGAEYAFAGPWSAKAEYLYVGLPSKNTHDLVRTGTSDTYNAKSDAHILRLGVNYHFGSASAADPFRSLASAAGIATRPIYKAPALAAFGWSGFYVGAVAGGALQNTIIDDKDCNLSCSSQNLDGSGFTAGGTLGWNYQFGAGVVGIEGDINWGNFKAEFTDPQWNNPAGTIHSAKWNWFSTVRGRAGLAVDRALIYATGGVAFVDVDVYGQGLTTGCALPPGCFSISGVQTGIAAGAGVEYALSGPWSAKAEYLYVGLPSKNTHDLVRTRAWDTYNAKSDAHILRLGMNYQLNSTGSAGRAMMLAYKAPATFSWSGFYVGAVAGGALQNTLIDDKNDALAYGSFNLNGSGVTAGGTLGWNYQFGAGLIGTEGDINWGNFKGEFVDQDWPSIHSAKWNWFSTIRGRAGLVVDRALIYATGGVAFVDVDIFGNSPNGACSSACFSITGVQTGIAAGVGAEYALAGPWSAKAEYLYVGLPSKNAHDLVRTNTYDTYDAKSDAHILRLGVNYRLGDFGKGPMVARY